MEAKDTVMSPEIVSPKFPDYIPCAVWDVLEAQAEITWPIAEKVGMRKVVEWIKTNSLMMQKGIPNMTNIQVLSSTWQAKLKEWGL